MAQLQEDVEDLAEYQPMLRQYVNEGYERVMRHARGPGWLGESLADEADEPAFGSERLHGILADWATFRILGTGSSSRQNRAEFFYARFMQGLSRVERTGNSEQIHHAYTR